MPYTQKSNTSDPKALGEAGSKQNLSRHMLTFRLLLLPSGPDRVHGKTSLWGLLFNARLRHTILKPFDPQIGNPVPL